VRVDDDGHGEAHEQRRRAVAAEIVVVQARIEALEIELRSIVEASEQANIDDEHDPEGATIAYERALVISLLDSARAAHAQLVAADDGLDRDSPATCVRCGSPIALERLLALPGTTSCVRCA
jgi:DnaK suppressor protein